MEVMYLKQILQNSFPTPRGQSMLRGCRPKPVANFGITIFFVDVPTDDSAHQFRTVPNGTHLQQLPYARIRQYALQRRQLSGWRMTNEANCQDESRAPLTARA